jgi:hypothetical protein
MNLENVTTPEQAKELFNLRTTNLNKLGIHLLSLPEDYQHFDMSTYTDQGYMPLDVAKQKSCGTAGCAIGHAPLVKGTTKPLPDEYYYEYSFRYSFKDEHAHQDRLSRILWSLMFDGLWEQVDNTPHGAGRRILFILRHGVDVAKFIERHIQSDSLTVGVLRKFDALVQFFDIKA